MNRILIFGPHPDDIEIGMGGTVLNLVETGFEVYLCDMTNGEPTPMGTVKKRMQERKKATGILGVKDRFLIGLKNRFVFDSTESRKKVAELIRKVKPDIIFVPQENDAHPDHIATTKIIEAARFYSKFTKTKWKGQPHYPKRIIYYIASHLRTVFKPDFLVDISPYMEKKLELVKAYKSQFIENEKNTRAPEYLRNIAAYYGRMIGVEYAEGFIMKEIPGFSNLKNFL